MRRTTWPAVALAAGLTTAALAGAAQAAPAWRCHASATSASLAGNSRFDPVTIDATPCVSSSTGGGNLAAPPNAPPSYLAAQTTTATTVATPAGGAPADQGVAGIARVENLAAAVPGTGLTLGVRAANAQVTGVCVAGRAVLTGTSEVRGVTLAGQELALEQIARQLSTALAPLGQVAQLALDEQVRTGGSLTERALHLRILPAAGGAPLYDLVVGEAQAGYTGAVCDRSAGAEPRHMVDGVLANGKNGGTCARLRMHFGHTTKRTLTSRYGRRVVVRGRLTSCTGRSIVRARIDVVHVVKGRKRLVKTGLRTRAGGLVTLILPMNLKTRDLRFEYRGNLLSSAVTARATLHLKVRNRRGKVLR